MKRSFAAVLASTALVLPVFGQEEAPALNTFFLQSNVPATLDWIDVGSGNEVWFTSATPGEGVSRAFFNNDPATAGMGTFGNLFDLNGFELRTEARTTSTPANFGGRLVVDNDNVGTAPGLLRLQAAVVTISGGVTASAQFEFVIAQNNMADPEVDLTIADADVLEGGSLLFTTGIGERIDLSINSLAGVGDIVFGQGDGSDNDGIYGFSVSSADAFSGDVVLNDGALTLDAESILAESSLIVADLATATVVLAADTTFASVNFGSQVLDVDGVFTAADLNSFFGTQAFSGAGTVAVPEPGTLALLGAGAVLMARRGRRSAA